MRNDTHPMNVFLVDPSADISARMLYKADPVRARKQLLECCQLLATADYIRFGKTTMLRADGEPYGKAHPHHPCTKHMIVSWDQQWLTQEVAWQLAMLMPSHACSQSLQNWHWQSAPMTVLVPPGDKGLIVVRFGHDPIIVKDRVEYARLCREYLEMHKGLKFE